MTDVVYVPLVPNGMPAAPGPLQRVARAGLVVMAGIVSTCVQPSGRTPSAPTPTPIAGFAQRTWV